MRPAVAAFDLGLVRDCPDLAAAVAAMTRAFREAGLDTPGLDARRLAASVLGLDETALLREPGRSLDHASLYRLAEAACRRLAREPVARIIGRRGFHGLDFEIGPATLDPRADTEALVEGALALVADGLVPAADKLRILDLGTGSGAILIALLAALPAATGLGIDISEDALALARRNADRLGVGGQCVFQVSDWYQQVAGRFDLVVANPPYILRETIAGLDPEVRSHDPIAALDGGVDGLDAYRSIAQGIGRVLAAGGWLACEIGIGQQAHVLALLRSAGLGLNHSDVQTWTDLGGVIRCVAARARC